MSDNAIPVTEAETTATTAPAPAPAAEPGRLHTTWHVLFNSLTSKEQTKGTRSPQLMDILLGQEGECRVRVYVM